MSAVSEPFKVYGEECLKYIDKPIGFASKGPNEYSDLDSLGYGFEASTYYNAIRFAWQDRIELTKFKHDVNKRIVGVVDRKFQDGGFRVILLGNEDISVLSENSCDTYYHKLILTGYWKYRLDDPSPLGAWVKDGEYQWAPSCPQYASPDGTNNSGVVLDVFGNEQSFIETLDYIPDTWVHTIDPYAVSSGTITNDPNNTVICGEAVTGVDVRLSAELQGDPLKYLSGDLYNLCYTRNQKLGSAFFPNKFTTYEDFSRYKVDGRELLMDGNNVSIPYNIILTYNTLYAQAYLETGVLPPDAFLFPLDWDALPSYDPDDEKDDDEDNDEDDDNKPGFDGDPDLPEVPRFPPSSLSNNNYYWLDVGQLENFISWFWNDVGELSDFDDLINKVKGLYSDLGSTILMLRYMPVDIANLGGLGNPSPIILGMIEKAGNVPTISKNPPPIVDIGHVKVPKEYKSFASHSPYAQCTLYLPFFGYLELDMDMFTGHDVYIKAIYDYLTGTIQYLIYYENKYLVNSMVCKMAVDIPITLQSKNDRDSAIFQNVSNAMAGLTSGTMSLASGNPIGLLGLGQAVNAGQQSAPLSVRGIVGEQGAFYAPNKCKLITTFPVQQKPSNFNEICGKQTNKTYTLSKISGYTECYNPRITFDKTVPLHEEEEEIYNYLEKGVIL